jgi:septum formation protein
MLVLASASPRRQELLRNARIDFVIQPADIPEERLPHESPTAFAERAARDKARAVATRLTSDGKQFPDPVFVLGADTVVVVDDQVLGKPEDAADAARMLRLLSGREHIVTTGVCLIGTEGARDDSFEDVRSCSTRVFFDTLTARDINAYISTGETIDKAGAYGIQGMASRWIGRIEGDYFNVVGLPVALVWDMLRAHSAM